MGFFFFSQTELYSFCCSYLFIYWLHPAACGKSCFLWNVCVWVSRCFSDMPESHKEDEIHRYSLNVRRPTLMLCCPFSSVTAKIKAIEAKLKMMAENPDAEYPAAPVYSYFKPPDKKRTTPYSRTAWKSRRWWLWMTALHTWGPLPLYL